MTASPDPDKLQTPPPWGADRIAEEIAAPRPDPRPADEAARVLCEAMEPFIRAAEIIAKWPAQYPGRIAAVGGLGEPADLFPRDFERLLAAWNRRGVAALAPEGMQEALEVGRRSVLDGIGSTEQRMAAMNAFKFFAPGMSGGMDASDSIVEAWRRTAPSTGDRK